MKDECLMCDCPVETAVAYVGRYPLCSYKCQQEWEDLTPEEKQRFIQCTNALHACEED